MELVSVVMPAFNAERFVDRAIQSALQQTEACIEIIVVDDCSSDATPSIVAGIAATDTRVRLLRNPANMGPAAARNRAFEEARGKWIALLDADDTYEPNRLEKLLKLAEQSRADIISDNLLLLSRDDDPPRPMIRDMPIPKFMSAAEFIEGNIDKDRTRRASYGYMKPMLRRDFIEAHQIRYREQRRFGEDYLLAVECLLKGAKWLVTPDPMYRYTVRPGSLSETASSADLNGIRTQEERWLRAAPMVIADPRLACAMRRHKATIDRWYHYLRFTHAVKTRCFWQAARLLLGRPERFWHIVMESRRQAPVIAAKALRGGYWRNSTMAVECKAELARWGNGPAPE